jgi:crotonobetainyl-CoA:carnitine CoA-transferase CaiB-like acyl-CoA transferase
VRQLAGLVRVGTFDPVRRRGPLLGENTDEVLTNLLGLDEEQLDQLASEGAFGSQYTGLRPGLERNT